MNQKTKHPVESGKVLQVKDYFLSLQASICQGLEELDPEPGFGTDGWERSQGGGGITRTLEAGSIFEKAGVNFSHVFGDGLPPSATAKRPELAGRQFQAMGVSLVIHPQNPYVPTTHANVRFFRAPMDGHDDIWWFGGGFDLTPFYPYREDAVSWHQTAKAACDTVDPSYYPRFKKWCDDYFFLKHRGETRGIGGLFFDDFNQGGFETSFSLVKAVGDYFLKAYVPIVKKRMNQAYGTRERDFQLYRRGRYVEFNLLYDRGTLFGIQTGGRTESILMSLPPLVQWRYDWEPEPGTPERSLTDDFLKPVDWLGLEK